MKALKITYWISTCLFSAVFLSTGTLYVLHISFAVVKFRELGFPLYVITLLGIAKLAGAITLLLPKHPRLKEWAYAGFVFDLIGAAWSHFAVQGFGQGIRLMIPITVAFTSYITYHRLHDLPLNSDSALDITAES